MDADTDLDKKEVRRPMNAFLIFCKRHRSMVRERNPHLDNRSVTRILGDLWANIGEEEKIQYTDLAKQYKDAFMKANPDYKWHNPERMTPAAVTKVTNRPTNERFPSVSTFVSEDGPIVPGKLADPSNMGGLSMLMEGNQVKGNQFTVNKDLGYHDIKSSAPSFLPTQQSQFPWISQQYEDFDEKKLIFGERNKPVMTKDPPDITQNYVKVNPETTELDTSTPTHLSGTLESKEENPSDPNEAVYSCDKFVMDHLIDKLYLPTVKNLTQSKLVPTPVSTVIKSQHTRENAIQPPQVSLFPPPSQGKKSYHTSIAVRNLLEFTRKAATYDMPSNSEKGQLTSKKQEKTIVSEAKQKLKDFCLKKESKPKIASENENSTKFFDVKDFKRKRCYSESCAELYKSQEKRMKLESNQFEDIGDKKSSPNGEDHQPTRKSRRRNRGQRYQELINEGIIQPSKARMAAMRGDTNIKNISFKDTFSNRRTDELGDEVLSVYPRQIRKRTMSESEKNRTSFDESSRYRTGDFDLEAHIKTLPACSLEKVVRPKRSVGKSLSESESGNTDNGGLKSESPEIPEIKFTVPPHLKAKPPESIVPVVGSRKRKARKHSITHLLPVKNDQKCDVPSTLSGVIEEKVSVTKLKLQQNCGCEPMNDESIRADAKINDSCNFQTESVKQSDKDFMLSVYDNDVDTISMETSPVGQKNKEAEKDYKSETVHSNENSNSDVTGPSEEIDKPIKFTKLKNTCDEDSELNKTNIYLNNCDSLGKCLNTNYGCLSKEFDKDSCSVKFDTLSTDNDCFSKEDNTLCKDSGSLQSDTLSKDNDCFSKDDNIPGKDSGSLQCDTLSRDKDCFIKEDNTLCKDSGSVEFDTNSTDHECFSKVDNTLDTESSSFEHGPLSKEILDDQDENSNDTKRFTNVINTDSNSCDTKTERKNDLTENHNTCRLDNMEKDVTVVTAVSVSIPMETESTENREQISQLQVEVSPVSQCDNNSVSMATIQTSLTCLC